MGNSGSKGDPEPVSGSVSEQGEKKKTAWKKSRSRSFDVSKPEQTKEEKRKRATSAIEADRRSFEVSKTEETRSNPGNDQGTEVDIKVETAEIETQTDGLEAWSNPGNDQGTEVDIKVETAEIETQTDGRGTLVPYNCKWNNKGLEELLLTSNSDVLYQDIPLLDEMMLDSCPILVNNIKARPTLAACLMRNRVIDQYTKDEIEAKGTTGEKNACLVEHIRTVGELHGFLKSLITNGQGYIVFNMGLDPQHIQNDTF